MDNRGTALSLLIVSDDWFARQLLGNIAKASGHFNDVIAVDDGYSALAETWEGVAQGAPPNVFLIDSFSTDASAGRLVTELRSDDATRDSCIAVLAWGEPVLGPIDLIIPCEPISEDIPRVMGAVATHAVAIARSRRAA